MATAIRSSSYSHCCHIARAVRTVLYFKANPNLSCVWNQNSNVLLCKSTPLPGSKGQADNPKSIRPICVFSTLRNLCQVNPKLPQNTKERLQIKMKEMAGFHPGRTKISLFWTDCCTELGNRMLRRMFKPHKLVLPHAINVSSTRLSWAHCQGSASHLTPPAEEFTCSSDRNS